MKKLIVSIALVLCATWSVFAQQFPPTFNAGPFPTGLETKRGDAPCDLNAPDVSGTFHEYTAYRGTPVVDGDVDNDAVWNTIPWTVMNSYDSGSGTCYVFDDACTDRTGYQGFEDITAWFKVLWDDENVYVAVKKIDNNYVYNEAHLTDLGSMWQDDAYQIVINTNDPNNNDGSGVATEIGVGLLAWSEAAYNNWSGTALALADGNGVSAVEICNGKAMIGSQVESDNYYTEVIEMAFVKWPEIVANEPQMFSIMCNDPDDDHTVQALQFGHGIFSSKDWNKYASIMWSPEVAPTSAVSDNQPSTPAVYALEQNYPNPFNPSTTIGFSLDRAQDVTLAVYDLLGNKICTLASGLLAAGQHQVSWNGADETGKTVANGVYFYSLTSGSRVETRKMMVLK